MEAAPPSVHIRPAWASAVEPTPCIIVAHHDRCTSNKIGIVCTRVQFYLGQSIGLFPSHDRLQCV